MDTHGGYMGFVVWEFLRLLDKFAEKSRIPAMWLVDKGGRG